MIDLHAHLLPALDDGPGSLAGSVDMARAAHAAGIRTMVCTPHMSDRYPTDPRAVEDGVAVVSEALDLAGVPLRVLQGGEIALSHLARLDEEGLRAASIGGGGRWLLLEMPFQGWPIALPQILADLEIQGYGVDPRPPGAGRVDPARPGPHARPGGPRRARAAHGGVASSASTDRPRGGPALMLLAGGVAHFLASDAHSAGPWRPPELEEGLQAAADGIDVHPQALRWMVEDGPAAVIEGRPVRPPRLTPGPPAARGRGHRAVPPRIGPPGGLRRRGSARRRRGRRRARPSWCCQAAQALSTMSSRSRRACQPRSSAIRSTAPTMRAGSPGRRTRSSGSRSVGR